MNNPAPRSVKRDVWLAWTIVGAGLLALLVWHEPLYRWFAGIGPESGELAKLNPAGNTSTQPDADEIDHYTCSMHPSVRQSRPGSCPICGMDLVPVTKGQSQQNIVTISSTRRQLIGVRTEQVREAKMVRSLRAVGRVTYDESRLSDVNLKVRGWVEKLYATNTGQHVQKGQALFTYYSPELYNAQQDFLLATRDQRAAGAGHANRQGELASATRRRLRLLDLSDVQLDEIARRGEPIQYLTYRARESGYLIEKDIVEGAAIEPGMRLYRIASLDTIWVDADVYEADYPRLRIGQKAEVSLDYLPGKTYEARVAYIYPYLNSGTRTGRVRLELVNEHHELRPGMYANVQLESELGVKLQVPSSAIVYTGPRRLVFVDLGEGQFRPQEVELGAEADGMFEVLSGLQLGDTVATSGVFLIASEARISTAATYWESSERGNIGAAATDPSMVAQEPPNNVHTPSATPQQPHAHTHASHSSSKPAKSDVQPDYTCPMHPEVHSPTPGKCPKCGMNLVPAARPETR